MAELAWLGVLRHGQSVGNVAAERAEAGGAETIDLDTPDAETPLSDLGARQAQTLARWISGWPPQQCPTVLVSSPYRRALDTATVVAAGAAVRVDERLRDRELGILDRLTWAGVAARLPEEHARRTFLGKFYYRPPGGESWADVALRLRSFLADLRRDAPGERVLLVGHEAVVFLLRYVIEELSVAQLHGLAARPLANAGLTSWERVDGRLRLAGFDADAAVRSDAAGSRQTHV